MPNGGENGSNVRMSEMGFPVHMKMTSFQSWSSEAREDLWRSQTIKGTSTDWTLGQYMHG